MELAALSLLILVLTVALVLVRPLGAAALDGGALARRFADRPGG